MILQLFKDVLATLPLHRIDCIILWLVPVSFPPAVYITSIQ